MLYSYFRRGQQEEVARNRKQYGGVSPDVRRTVGAADDVIVRLRRWRHASRDLLWWTGNWRSSSRSSIGGTIVSALWRCSASRTWW